jgi:hypothetical protein
MSETSLKKTPLNAVHRGLGGRMVDFGEGLSGNL